MTAPQESRARTPPSVDVVIPTQNRRALLSRTLHTVLEQTGVTVRVVVVDDASEDDTAAYLRALDDRRVVVVRHAVPQGVAAARNCGLQEVRSEWVAFVDDDDLWAPGKLHAQIEAVRAVPGAEWACSGTVIVGSDLRILWAQEPPDTPDVLDRLLIFNRVPGGGSGVVARTDLVRAVGGFDPALSTFADWDLWIRLAERARLAAVRRPLLAYLLHDGSLSQRTRDPAREIDHVARKHVALRQSRGVRFDDAPALLWAAEMHERAGASRAAASIYGDLAWRLRSPRLAHRTVKTVFGVKDLAARDARRGRAVPPGWADEATGWLTAVARMRPDG